MGWREGGREKRERRGWERGKEDREMMVRGWIGRRGKRKRVGESRKEDREMVTLEGRKREKRMGEGEGGKEDRGIVRIKWTGDREGGIRERRGWERKMIEK